MVPRSMLKEWALHTFPNATDYWTFRKMFTIQLALIGLAEFMLHLNRLNPEMLQIAQVGGTNMSSACWTCRQGHEGSIWRANLIDIHTQRCIKRSLLPSSYHILPCDIYAEPMSQSSAVTAKAVLTELIFSASARLSKTFQFEGLVFVCACLSLSANTHCSAVQGWPPQSHY